MMTLLKKVDTELGVPFGLQAVYASIILRPETLFRFEGTEASDDDTGLVALSRRELATSLAFALTDLPPDGNLLRAFENNESSPRDILMAETRRLLDDDIRPTARNRLLQFFQEYFDYLKAEDVFKDQIKGTSTGLLPWCMILMLWSCMCSKRTSKCSRPCSPHLST